MTDFPLILAGCIVSAILGGFVATRHDSAPDYNFTNNETLEARKLELEIRLLELELEKEEAE